MNKPVLNAVQCPTCLVGERHPNTQARFIRVQVVEDSGVWYSQCLVCAGMWDENLKLTPSSYNENKGWFAC